MADNKEFTSVNKIEKTGQVILDNNKDGAKIQLITIIGEVEGHDVLPATSKSTKYEHILPQLAAVEDNRDIDGVLFLLNTVGGDVSAGLALAEMISSLSKPTVSLVLGDSHSIGVPLAVACDYSFITPTGTMIIHPVRMSGTVIGAPQTYDYFKRLLHAAVHALTHILLSFMIALLIPPTSQISFLSTASSPTSIVPRSFVSIPVFIIICSICSLLHSVCLSINPAIRS